MKRNKLVVDVVTFIVVAAIVVMGVFLVGKALPYEGVELASEDIKIQPHYSCGGEEVNVTYMMASDDSVDRMTGFAYWVSGEDDRPYSSIFFDGFTPEVSEEKVEVEGPTRRVSPWPVDEWHAGIHATVYGTRWGFIPVEQEVWLESSDSLNSQGREGEGCSVGGGGQESNGN